MEEISSDSADELLNKKQKKSKKKAKAATNNAKSSTAATANPTANNGTVKKATVLELLELQARARAIRSQLALEPVTKIELDDSDVENVNDASELAQPVAEQPTGSVAAVLDEAQATSTRPQLELAEPIALEPVQRPIRLKRNFRTRNTDNDDDGQGEDAAGEKSTNEPEEQRDNGDDTATNGTAKDASPKIPEKERSLSPDIIPIIKEPEILCISSSDESDHDDEKTRSGSYIKMPTASKENRPETEDEIFLRKVKESALGKNTAANGNEPETAPAGDAANTVDAQSIKKPDDETGKNATGGENSNVVSDLNKNPPKAPEPDPEPEEGEIIEDDVEEALTVVNIDDSSNSSHDSKSSQSSGSSSGSSSHSSNSSRARDDGKLPETGEINTANTSANSDIMELKAETSEVPIDDAKNGAAIEAKVQNESIADEEEDDDIIDLGKDEDLDFDMAPSNESPPKKRKTDKEVADEPATSSAVCALTLCIRTRSTDTLKKIARTSKMMVAFDVPASSIRSTQHCASCAIIKSINLFSNFYPIQNDSWGTRWLRGRKVSTVLATSKLASKVRSKIKEKKVKSTETKLIEEPVEVEKPPEVELPSNIEVGSVEHYNELTKNII